jgi:hypothetical protein
MTALTYYVDTGGADTNSGTTSGTSPLANGTAATRSGAVYTLDGSPDLSGVTANVDTIHIVGETSGRGADGTIFEITAVDDGADTVTVDPTPTGGTSGLTWAIGGAFATIDKSMSVVAAGDKVWVKASGNYNEVANVDTAGTLAAPIMFEGYTSTTGDNGKVTIDGQSTRANCITSSVSTSAYYIFANFIFTGATSVGCYLNLQDATKFINCEFNNNGGDGCFGDNSILFVNCLFNGNTGNGCDVDVDVRLVGCIAQGNAGPQFKADNFSVIYRCLVYNTAATGPAIDVAAGEAFIGNTVDGEGSATSDGVWLDAIGYATAIDNIVYDWDEGFKLSASFDETTSVIGYNLMNSNTTNYSYSDTHGTTGYQDVTAAPDFVDEAGDNYKLNAASPARNAGLKPGGLT